MNRQQEEYIHIANSIDSLNTTWRILRKIKDDEKNSLASFAFQFALIEYSKPYKNSNSAVKENGKPLYKYRLASKFVPEKYLELHNRILNIRDKILAHLDLDIRDAKVYVQGTEGGRNIIRSQNIIDGASEIDKIEDIIILIEGTLEAMKEEAKRLGDNLPINL